MKLIKQEVYNALYQDYYESYYDQPLSYSDIIEIVESAKKDGSLLSDFTVSFYQDHSNREEDRQYENLSDLEPLFGKTQNNDIHQITFNSKLGEEPVVSHLISPNAGYYNKMVFNKRFLEKMSESEKTNLEEKKYLNYNYVL